MFVVGVDNSNNSRMDDGYSHITAAAPLRNNAVSAQEAFSLLSLPSEVLDIILANLSAVELARVGSTCKELRERCWNNMQCWHNLIAQDFYNGCYSPQSEHVSGMLNYSAHLQAFKQRREVRIWMERERLLGLDWQARRRRIHNACNLLFGVETTMLILGVCVLAVLILLSDQEENLSLVFIPVWLLLVHVFSGMIASLVLLRFKRALAKRGEAHSVFYELWDISQLPAAYWFRLVTTSFHHSFRVWVLPHFFATLLLFLVFFILLFVRCLEEGNAVTLTWLGAFAPLWLALIAVFILFFPPILKLHTSEEWEAMAIAALVFIPPIAFFIALSIWLDSAQRDDKFPITLAFIPLYLQAGIFFLVITRNVISSCWREEGVARNILVWFFSMCLLAPILAFELLIVQFADEESKWEIAQVLTPLLVWFSLFTLNALLSCCLTGGGGVADSYCEAAYRPREYLQQRRRAAFPGDDLPAPDINNFQMEFEQLQLDMLQLIVDAGGEDFLLLEDVPPPPPAPPQLLPWI